MSLMIVKNRELIRVSPKDSKNIEFSTNQGRSWFVRYHGSASLTGCFVDLSDNGSEILAQTSKGLFYSKTNGRNWFKRS